MSDEKAFGAIAELILRAGPGTMSGDKAFTTALGIFFFLASFGAGFCAVRMTYEWDELGWDTFPYLLTEIIACAFSAFLGFMFIFHGAP